MIGSRAFGALMRRNLVYRRRNWISSLFEFLLPVCFVAILVAIKNAAENGDSFESEIREATFPKASFTPFSFQDYVTAMKAEKVCINQTDNPSSDEDFLISGILDNGKNWPVPFVKCDSRKCDFAGQSASDFCEYAVIAVSPSGDGDTGGRERAEDFKEWLEATYSVEIMPFSFNLVQLFDSPDQMDNYVKAGDYGKTGFPKIGMGIVFEGNDDNKYIYSLRQNSTNFNAPEEEGRPATSTTPDPGKLFDDYAKNDFDVCRTEGGTPDLGRFDQSCTGQYMYNGVLTFQRLVGDFILNRTEAAERGYFVSEAGVQFTPFPTRPYEESGFYDALDNYGPIIVVLGLLYPVASMIGYVVKEKELRQKELMKMMSVRESDLGWSWFLTFMLFHLITSIFLAFVSTVLYENSDGLLLWVYWLLSLIAVVVFCLTVSSITSKSTRAVLIGLLLFFAGVFLTLAVDYQDGSKGAIAAISLHPVAALSYGLKQIGRLEDNGVGLTTDTIDYSENRSGYAFNDTLLALLIDCFLWGIAAWYLNRVIRPDFGQAEPWWFPFLRSYWCPGCTKTQHDENDVLDAVVNHEIPYEPVGDALKRQAEEGKSIEIRNLYKTFGDKTAVDGLSLSMYSGQITALLGHNGAGKTTTLSMLTGAIAPTEGYAKVAGKDIRTQIQQIRQDIGICLQHDCIFPSLTVHEHVRFFSRLKGLFREMLHKDAEEHIDQAIRDVALFEKRNTLAKNLSGGMKRKLSVAMAFCGGSKVVLLDEPTSGMDPFSRRFTWNVIRQYRQDRCIILTTHFMDEADILGDRIAIMAEGRLCCAGSSLFLKKTYGVGYQLTIEKNQSGTKERVGGTTVIDSIRNDGAGFNDEEENGCSTLGKQTNDEAAKLNSITSQSREHMGTRSSDEELKKLMKYAVPESKLLFDVGTEMRYQLPMSSSSQFVGMFEQLDREVEKGTVESYGVSITTLDEVFLLVARGDHLEQQKTHLASSMINTGSITLKHDDASSSARSRMDLEKEGLFNRHMRALLRKRAANFRRDKKAWVCTTIVPSIFVLIGFLIFKFTGPERNLDPVTLDLSNYNDDVASPLQNPIAFNSPGNPYMCQPGICAYQADSVSIAETNEKYFFCGSQANLEILDSTLSSCSITESEEIIGLITDRDGAAPEGTLVSTVNESSHSLFDSSDDYVASQYGAIWYTHDLESTVGDGVLYNNTVIGICQDSSQGTNYTSPASCARFGGVGYMIQYNFTALHVTPLFQALADEALVRYATENPDFTIKSTIAPLPITKVEEGFGQAEDAFLAWFLVVLSFPFIAGAFASFIVLERESKAKHLQTVAGVEPSAYWLSTYVWDSLNYQIPLWITVALMFIFDVEVLTTREQNVFSGVLAILFFFGPASAGFAYCVSFAFTSASLCNVVIIISGFLVGMGGPMTVFILTLIGEGDPNDPRDNLITAANVVTWILRFIPSFCLGKGLFNAINIETFAALEEDENLSAWSEPVLLVEVIFLVGECFVYVFLAILLDKWSSNPSFMSGWQKFTGFITCQWIHTSKDSMDITTALPEDDDVLAEQDRVLNGEADRDLIVLSQLTKVYANGKIAVNNMSLGIPHGECFGLLGINGAGKTTTMQMLTAEFPPTSGDATLAGYSVSREPQKIRRRIGYCPQFDAHFANMTGREHVELYASVKGVPGKFVKEAAAKKLEEVGLSEFDSDRLCAVYSGGMKRRLSLACATIGQPQIVFLDEASTGVDPVARREIWQLISNMVAGQNVQPEERTSVILTTHSMEECEALCPRLGIMANGRLRCLGSAQHLKNKFGQGYQIELKAKIVDREDDDYISNAAALAGAKRSVPDLEAWSDAVDGTFFTHSEMLAALQRLTGDTFLSSMVSPDNEHGYSIWKDSTSGVGVPLDALAAFATNELRMRSLETFVGQTFPKYILRERQDSKARYEVSTEGTRISSIFAAIEAKKEELCLADYGVSQTSLEQVFNMHAAEAERLKQGRDDH